MSYGLTGCTKGQQGRSSSSSIDPSIRSPLLQLVSCSRVSSWVSPSRAVGSTQQTCREYLPFILSRYTKNKNFNVRRSRRKIVYYVEGVSGPVIKINRACLLDALTARASSSHPIITLTKCLLINSAFGQT